MQRLTPRAYTARIVLRHHPRVYRACAKHTRVPRVCRAHVCQALDNTGTAQYVNGVRIS